MPNFFVPFAKDAVEAESVYASFEKQITYPLRHPTARLFRIVFTHDRWRCIAEVGSEIRGWPEPEGLVLGIVETTNLVYVCTQRRAPEAILVGPGNISDRKYFDDRNP